MLLTDPGKFYLRGAQNSAFASTMDPKEQKMDQKGQKCFAKQSNGKTFSQKEGTDLGGILPLYGPNP